MHLIRLVHLLSGGLAAQVAYGQQTVLALNPTSALSISIDPTSLTPEVLQTALSDALGTGQVRDVLRGASYRLLQVDNLHSWAGSDKRDQNGFRAAIADYTNGRTIYVSGDDVFGPASSVSVADTNNQPLPSPEEVAEAAAIAGFGPDAVAYSGMPPIIDHIFPNGSSHRILNIMARQRSSTDSLEPVHVNMNNRTAKMVAFTKTLPTCAATLDALNKSSAKGLPGAANVVISRGNTTLWELVVVRPSASSAGKAAQGSGVELRNVRYKGKKVLGRAHLPILNVEYLEVSGSSNCGPSYRDFQNEEYPFDCQGSSVPGHDYFRICTSPPRTIVDSKKDGGNFAGVAFYADDKKVAIRSQLKAGWYRYTSEWVLREDGVIEPRWGFGGVIDGRRNCVCVKHHHHAYWRFDFDIETPGGNLVHEYNDPPLDGESSNYHEILYPCKRPKDRTRRQQYWQISNTGGQNSYALYPGALDGEGDKYGVDGVWIMKFDANQLDDGIAPYTEEKEKSMAHLDSMMDVNSRDALHGTDVLLWYSAHFLHDENGHRGGDHAHYVGPVLRPIQWH